MAALGRAQSLLRLRNLPDQLVEFPEGNTSCYLCSAQRQAAGTDMLYQHAYVLPVETPLGALIFPKTLLWSQCLSQLHDSDVQQDFCCVLGRGTGITQPSGGASAWRLFYLGR